MLTKGQYLLTLQFTLTDRRLHFIMDMDKCHITMEIIGMLLTNLLYLLLTTLLSLYPNIIKVLFYWSERCSQLHLTAP